MPEPLKTFCKNHEFILMKTDGNYVLKQKIKLMNVYHPWNKNKHRYAQ